MFLHWTSIGCLSHPIPALYLELYQLHSPRGHSTAESGFGSKHFLCKIAMWRENSSTTQLQVKVTTLFIAYRHLHIFNGMLHCWVKVIHTAEQNLPKNLAKSCSLVALWLAIMELERRNFDKIAKIKQTLNQKNQRKQSSFSDRVNCRPLLSVMDIEVISGFLWKGQLSELKHLLVDVSN